MDDIKTEFKDKNAKPASPAINHARIKWKLLNQIANPVAPKNKAVETIPRTNVIRHFTKFTCRQFIMGIAIPTKKGNRYGALS